MTEYDLIAKIVELENRINSMNAQDCLFLVAIIISVTTLVLNIIITVFNCLRFKDYD